MSEAWEAPVLPSNYTRSLFMILLLIDLPCSLFVGARLSSKLIASE